MKKTELIQILTILSSNYQSIAKLLADEDKSKIICQTWYSCIGDLDYELALAAVQKAIISSSYPPTIHDIREAALGITEEKHDDSVELWNEAYKMICNGTYMTKEEFETHSPLVKRFFGDVAQVKSLAQADAQTVNTVTRGQFLKQIEVLREREHQEKLLPEELKKAITGITNNIGMIEGAN